jgi:hypothetical protein
VFPTLSNVRRVAGINRNNLKIKLLRCSKRCFNLGLNAVGYLFPVPKGVDKKQKPLFHKNSGFCFL